MIGEGRAGAALLTVHHLLIVAVVLIRAHLLGGHLPVMEVLTDEAILTNPCLLKVYLRLVVLVEVLTDAVMVTDLLLPEVFLPLVVVEIQTLHPLAAWIRIDKLSSPIT